MRSAATMRLSYCDGFYPISAWVNNSNEFVTVHEDKTEGPYSLLVKASDE